MTRDTPYKTNTFSHLPFLYFLQNLGDKAPFFGLCYSFHGFVYAVQGTVQKAKAIILLSKVVFASSSCVSPAVLGLEVLVWLIFEVVDDFLDQIAGVLEVGLIPHPKCICIR